MASGSLRAAGDLWTLRGGFFGEAVQLKTSSGGTLAPGNTELSGEFNGKERRDS